MKLQKNNKYKNSLIASVVAFNAVLTACGVTPKNTDIKPVETKIETVKVMETTPSVEPTPIEVITTEPTPTVEPVEEPLSMTEEIERLGMLSEGEICSASEIFAVKFKKDNMDKMMLCRVVSDDDTIYIHDAFTEVELFS